MSFQFKAFISAFRQTANTYPKQLALIEGERQWTYTELLKEVIRISHSIQLKPQSKIGLHLDKSAEFIIGILVACELNCPFIPLDPKGPNVRLQKILTEAQPELIFTKTDCPIDTQIPTLDLLNISSPRQVPIEKPLIKEDDLAYIIFTSGSSGTPKGVMIPQRGWTYVLEHQIKAFGLNHQSRFLWVLSPLFDASLSDIGTPLLSGACLVIPPPKIWEDPEDIYKVLSQYQITHVDLPPSLLPHLNPERFPPSFQTLVIGGEPSDPEHIRHWTQFMRVLNVYGPTETTICSSLGQCHPTWSTPLLGSPFKDTEYLILNSNHKKSEQGELYISGPGVAVGYLNQTALTQQKFKKINGKRWFATGDWVKENMGDYHFLGRIDRQIKQYGKLIAPEEIEACLKKACHSSVAVIQCQQGPHTFLCAFIESPQLNVPRLNQNEKIKQVLKQTLPKWMRPQILIDCPSLPLTHSKKIDYPKLKSIDINDFLPRPVHHASSVSYETEQLLTLWQGFFHNSHLDTDFFQAGGSSLQAIELMAWALQNKISLQYTDIQEYPTPRQLGEFLLQSKTLFPIESSQEEHIRRFHNDIQVIQEQSPLPLPPNHQTRSVFITGATGFLGSHLLAELLKDSSLQFTCLIRSKNNQHAFKRLKHTFKNYQLDPPSDKRIQCLSGDLSLPHLGLDKASWIQLAQSVDTVIHSAAQVHQLATYEMLFPANVTGTKNVFELLLEGRAKRFHYMSTLSVFVGSDQNQGCFFETDDLSQIKTLYGGYAQSKWVSEKWLQTLKKYHPISIYRLGLLTGHSQTGLSPQHDWFRLLSQGLVQLKALPQIHSNTLAMDITPIDYATQILAKLILKAPPKTYHIANPQALKIKNYFKNLQTQCTLKTLPSEQWLKHSQKYLKTNNSIALSAALLALASALFPDQYQSYRHLDIFQATEARFDMSHTDQYCPKEKHPCPTANKGLLKVYFKAFFKS